MCTTLCVGVAVSFFRAPNKLLIDTIKMHETVFTVYSGDNRVTLVCSSLCELALTAQLQGDCPEPQRVVLLLPSVDKPIPLVSFFLRKFPTETGATEPGERWSSLWEGL